MNTDSLFRRSLLLVVTSFLVIGLVAAAHFVFTVSQAWDSEATVNEAHVQNRAGQLNVARAVGDTVTATFSDNRSGNFVRQFLISTNAFRQTGGPFSGGGGGGGTCSIVDPVSTLLTLTGATADLGRGSAAPLTVRGTAEDGTPIVLDQFAVVSITDGRAQLSNASFGFSGLLDETKIASALDGGVREAKQLPDILVPGIDARDRTRGAPVLLIQHQGAHPANHNFSPTPKVLFTRQALRPARTSMRRGWAIMAFGKMGQLHDVVLLPADGGLATAAIAAGLKAAVRTEFQDDRRHPHTVYVAFELTVGGIDLRGPPFVTMPMCCSCDPDPYDDIEYQCP